MRLISGLLSLASLAACLALPVVHFQGGLTEAAYKGWMLVASLVWFFAATMWAARKGQPR